MREVSGADLAGVLFQAAERQGDAPAQSLESEGGHGQDDQGDGAEDGVAEFAGGRGVGSRGDAFALQVLLLGGQPRRWVVERSF